MSSKDMLICLKVPKITKKFRNFGKIFEKKFEFFVEKDKKSKKSKKTKKFAKITKTFNLLCEDILIR